MKCGECKPNELLGELFMSLMMGDSNAIGVNILVKKRERWQTTIDMHYAYHYNFEHSCQFCAKFAYPKDVNTHEKFECSICLKRIGYSYLTAHAKSHC